MDITNLLNQWLLIEVGLLIEVEMTQTLHHQSPFPSMDDISQIQETWSRQYCLPAVQQVGGYHFLVTHLARASSRQLS